MSDHDMKMTKEEIAYATKFMNQLLHTQHHGNPSDKKPILDIPGEGKYMSIPRMALRVLPYIPGNIGAAVRKHFDRELILPYKYTDDVIEDLGTTIGIWANAAGKFWPIASEMLRHYSLQSQQGNQKITADLVKYFNHPMISQYPDLVFEERNDRIKNQTKKQFARRKLLLQKEKETFQSYKSLYIVTKEEVQRRQ